MGMSTLAAGRGPSTAMSNFMRQQARSLIDTPWQIIQVNSTVIITSILMQCFIFEIKFFQF